MAQECTLSKFVYQIASREQASNEPFILVIYIYFNIRPLQKRDYLATYKDSRANYDLSCHETVFKCDPSHLVINKVSGCGLLNTEQYLQRN